MFNFEDIPASRAAITTYQVDSSNFLELQHLIESILNDHNISSRNIVPQIEEAYIDTSDQLLIVTGYYRYTFLCYRTCQHRVNNMLDDFHNKSQCNKFDTLNKTTRISIGSTIHRLKLTGICWSNTTPEIPVVFVYEMQSNSDASRRRRRRQQQQIFNNSDSESVYKLVQQTLQRTKNNQYVPFVISNTSWHPSLTPVELSVSIILRYPTYCSETCRRENIGELFDVIVIASLFTDLNYTFQKKSYKILRIKPLGPEDVAPVSLQTLSFKINTTNFSNVEAGPITDTDSLNSITDAINTSLGLKANFKVVSASWEPELSSKSIKWLSSQRIRRLTNIRYKLVVVIKFIFVFSTCDFRCQRMTLAPIINQVIISTPPSIIIGHMIFRLFPPTIEPIVITPPSPILTTKVTNPPTTTITVTPVTPVIG